jgi:hypothetical protein
MGLGLFATTITIDSRTAYLAGEAALLLPLSRTWALDLRVPFVATPGGSGSPSLALAWAVYDQPEEAHSTLYTRLRVHAPAASDDLGRSGDAYDLGAVLPFGGPAWERAFTVSVELAWRVRASRYTLLAEAAVQIGAAGQRTPQVAVAYSLCLAVRAVAELEALVDVAGRAFAESTFAEPRSLVGLGVGVRYRVGAFAPRAGARFPLGYAHGLSTVVAEVGLDAFF